jgi:Spy/CpxP family protein refolding chaperone
MIRKIFGAFALALVLVAGLAAAGMLYAQQSGGMSGMMSMMEKCPMMGAMRESPQAALEHRQELGLTEAQVRQMESLQEGVKQARMQAMERMRAVHEEIAAATEGEIFDEAAVRAAFDRMGDLHTEAGVAMLRTRHEVRQVLTPEQREKLSELGGGMMDMHGMMQMMGGMEHCPMMQGGMMGEGIMKGMQDSGAHRMHHQKQL